MSELEADAALSEYANPFVAPSPSFYEGGDRKGHLDKLRHLSQWSRRVVLVTGPRGIGKSAMYRQLSASLEPRAKAARINGSLVNSAHEVLTAIVHGFGLAAPADADAQLLQEIISEHADDQQRAGRYCATLVDDADLLEPRAMEQLMALAGRSPLRVVMFGEVRLVRAVERQADLLDVEWHEIRLAGFTLQEVRAYLQWRFSRVGYRQPLPFSDAQIRDLARLSEGLPGRIDQMANVLMTKVQARGVATPRRRFPPLHTALLAVLVVVLGLVYLLQPGSEPGSGSARQVTAVERIEIPRGQAADADAGAAIPGRAETLGVTRADAGSPATAITGPPPATEPPPATVPPPAPRQETPPVSAAPAAAAPQPPAAPAQEARPDPQPAVQRPAGARDARWVMAQPGDAYTVQLVTLSSAERVAQYLASQPDPSQFASYRLQRDGRILHVVVFGSFPSRDAAEAASRRLPASVGSVQPWIRPFAHVHEAARSAIQQ
ncbi:MAG: AAA family ATPase [Pseudomonadales bacterium]